MKLILCSCGNPDFGQNPHAPMSEPQEVEVATVQEASEKCREYIRENSLGGGNWKGGQVLKDGKPFAYVSYNGRVWLPAPAGRRKYFMGGGVMHPDWDLMMKGNK
jgi:hypothetical protein